MFHQWLCIYIHAKQLDVIAHYCSYFTNRKLWMWLLMHALAINHVYLCLFPHHHYTGYDISHFSQYRRQHLVCGRVPTFRDILIDNKRSGNRPVRIDNHISGNPTYSRVPFSATRCNIPRYCTRHCNDWGRVITVTSYGRDGVSNHQSHHCLLNCLFRWRSKKTLKLRVTGLCVGNSPVTGEFPAQRASNAENISIWWRRHVNHRQPRLCVA